MKTKDVQTTLSYYTHLFQRLGLDSPRLSAELILSKALQVSRLDILAGPQRSITSNEMHRIIKEMNRREKGEPVAYILGYKEFYGYDFFLDSSVLVPRPETESIVDQVLDLFPVDKQFEFADVCTGSGVLGIVIATKYRKCSGIGTDIFDSSLNIVKKNIVSHRVDERFLPVKASFAQCFRKNSLDLIVSNPPYLSFEQYKSLSREIKDFEPSEALIAGENGTEKLPELILQFAYSLKSGGYFFMEIDSSMRDYVFDLLKGDFGDLYNLVDVYKDFSAKNRVLAAKRL